MRVFDTLFRFAMPALVLITMITGFAVGHELALILLDPMPWSFIYNMVAGLIGTAMFSLALVKASRVYFTKQFDKTMASMGIKPQYVFEEAGNGLAIDVEQGKVVFIDQGVAVSARLSDIDRFEVGQERKSTMSKSVYNSTLHIYTTMKDYSLITISFGLNATKRDQAGRQLEAVIAASQKEDL